MSETVQNTDIKDTDIAIVGMAAHLPGADTLDTYWKNLRDGIESITRLDDDALDKAGESETRRRHKNYVPAAAILEGFERFDADFFGLSPKDAAIMDPQHRQFLEVSWEALENAGHPPENFEGPVGVFAGCGMGSYFYFNICSNPDLVDNTGMFLLRHTGNDKDFLSTRLSHILDLKGPSLSLQTACSTSLVAVHYASQALLNGECDMALAGGVTIELPHGRGYVFQDGEILSPDGHCHAFDHRAQGTVFGSGAGVVVLRRLSDAIADGDHIWGVIKGSAVNNDGSAKAGYLAPSVDGQAAAIADAQAIADVSADTIDYVECHGTGTYLGDPIEVAALTEAFRETTPDTGFCRIGSVKSNIGHLDTAAGAASLIKTALSLHHRQIPPSLGYEASNPAIDFDNSPFRVNDSLSDWNSTKGPRRAGVNSLGVGGTNAHVVVEEAPKRAPSQLSDWPFQLLTISGRNKKALDANTAALATHLRAHPEQPLADVAYTLAQGRRAFEKRRVVVAETHEDAARLLTEGNNRRVFTHTACDAPETVFMFPGGGTQYVGMGRDLYETEPVFQEWMDRGFEVLQPKLEYDICAIWLATDMNDTAAAAILQKPSVQLPLIMIVEYALAQLWISWGIKPAALVGHSMGENTAACLAGVISFEDCIGLVLLRGQLFDTVATGGMLSVPLPVAKITPLLGENLSIAGINAPELTVVSGPQAALDVLAKVLAKQDIATQRIPIDIAAHSAMLDPILERFRAYLQSVSLSSPTIPIVSNRTGAFLLDTEACDPDYWVDHLRNAVHFADCIATLAQKPNRIFLEVGPGKALSALARMNGNIPADKILSSLRHLDETFADDAYFLSVLGQFWACGALFDWAQYWGDIPRQRVVLPTYAFQRSSYFIEPGKTATTLPELVRQENTADWSYAPFWKQRLADCDFDLECGFDGVPTQSWLIFADETGLGAALVKRLRHEGHVVTTVTAGDTFARLTEDAYVLAPERGREGYDALIGDLMTRGRAPDRIVHLWLTTNNETFRPGSSFFHRNQEHGFYSLMFLSQAISTENLPTPIHMSIITTGAVQVRGESLLFPEKSTVLGPAQVAPRELPGLTCATLDIETPKSKTLPKLIDRLLEDLLAQPGNSQAAYRGEKRYEKLYRKVPLNPEVAPVWAQNGTYLITGGFGGIGLTLAEDLIRKTQANIVLVSRTALPDRADWSRYLNGHSAADKTARKMRAIQRLEALGGSIISVAADVCNIDEMRTAKCAVIERFGPITGLIHAAGVIDDGPLLTKTAASVEDVLAPKLHGTQVLNTLFPDGSLDWMVLFSSSSTATAPAGQIDYVAANAYLNAYAEARHNGATKVIAINWGLWSDVGMAAEAVAARQGTHTLEEPTQISAPILQKMSFDTKGHPLFTATLDATRDWVLDDHRTAAGDAILPGTGYLELAAEALEARGETSEFELRDLMFLRPLKVADDMPCNIRVRLKRSEEGYRFVVQSTCTFEGRSGFQTHAEARIILGAHQDAPILDISALQARMTNNVQLAGPTALISPQEAHLQFGPRWKVLRSMAFGDGEGLASLTLGDQFVSDLGLTGFKLHPGLLDIATGWAMALIDGYQATHLWVPVSYNSAKVFAALPAKVTSWARLTSGDASSGVVSFDVTLADLNGAICAEIKGLTLRQIKSEQAFGTDIPLRANEVELTDTDSDDPQPLSAREERLAYNLSQGIPAQSGGQMFAAALTSGLSQVVISSLDLPTLMAQSDASVLPTQDDAHSFERPELDTDYMAPETDVERTLAGFWQELLGVTKVGTQDSFFDLGGHSLIAVRLFAMVKKTYRIDFPISVLFEAPTVAKCAALISAKLGPQDDTSCMDSPQERATRRFTHLVPMHEHENTTKIPFFLVAGMFGNVLNLRHLAHLIGSDRPFYGLQARGLYGDADPHCDLVSAAADYIAELRMVQPNGPYLLGGFSGGGITAFEMARQLEEQGETVSLVALLDTPLPVRRPLTRKDRAHIQWQELKRNGPLYPVRWLQNRLRWELDKRRRAQTTELSETSAFHDANIEAAFLEAVSKYKMRHWSGRLVLFRPALVAKWQLGNGRLVDHQRAYVFEDNDWRQWVPDVSVYEVPGDHDSMVLEPNVRVLANGLRKIIAEAENAQVLSFPNPKHAAE